MQLQGNLPNPVKRDINQLSQQEFDAYLAMADTSEIDGLSDPQWFLGVARIISEHMRWLSPDENEFLTESLGLLHVQVIRSRCGVQS